MASSFSPLSKSIAVIPTIINGSPEKSLCFNSQNLRSNRCLQRIFINCAVSMRRKHFRRNSVAGLKSCLQFRQFAEIFYVEMEMKIQNLKILEGLEKLSSKKNTEDNNGLFWRSCLLPFVISSWLSSCQVAQSSVGDKKDMVYEIGELFELGIQLSYLLILLGLLGLGTFFVIRQVLVRRELDLSAKELQEQVRSGDATATEYFELGAVMLRRKVYPVATKYLQQAIEKWDRDDQDLAQVHNALGVSYVRDKKIDEGIAQFETAVKLQPGYVTAWNNMGDAYEKKKNLKMALRAFEQVLLFDPNNKIARPRRDALRDRVQLYKGVPIKSEER